MKTLSLALMALMIVSIFVSAIVIAENEEVTNISEISDSASTVGDTNEVIAESESVIAETDERVIGLGAATLAEGWSISSDNTKAEITTGIWVSKKYLKVNVSKTKEIRDKYKGDKAKIIEELKKLTSETQITSHGRLNIGIGTNKEKFKLFKKEITDEKASFYVVPMLKQTETTIEETAKLKQTETTIEETAKASSVGTLELTKKQYTNLALWTGKLVLTSGNNKGDWSVSLASKTKLIRGIGKEVVKQTDNLKQKTEEIKEKAKEMNKKWWQFWQKAKK